MSTLVVKGLVKRFGGLTATDYLDLDIREGEIHAIIGPNGAGKSTLINQLAGELPHDEGSIHFQGREISGVPVNQRTLMGIARSYQITSVFMEFTALQNVMLAVQGASGRSNSFWQPVRSDRRLVEPAWEFLDRVGLGDQAHTRVSSMAYGARRQLELAMTMALKPKVMLLDEPMAGMSQTESEGMVALLRKLKGAYSILLVEHDMDAVFALADRVTVVVYGKPIACGTPEEMRHNLEVREAYLGDEFEG
jgi:branched-chain amino acid transport system ATP-binding protein